MKRWCLAVLMMVVLAGCTKNGATKINLETREYETDTAAVEIQVPAFAGMADAKWQEQLNGEIENEINACLEQFTKESAAEQGVGGEKSVLRITQDIACNRDNFVSLVSECHVFAGGPHSTTARSVRNLDMQQNKQLKLADLFLDDGYQSKLGGEIDRILAENPEEYQDLWEKPMLGAAQEECFYIENGDLVIFYPPYELSYYARGFVEFRIPIGDLTGYIKPEYMVLA